MKPLIVGIAGRKRSGKNSVAALAARGFLRLAFADHLKWLIMQTWDMSFDQVFSDELKEQVDPRWGFSPRQALQQVGTEVGRKLHSDTWVRKTLDTIRRGSRGEEVILPNFEMGYFEHITFDESYAQRWVIPDVRFPNEADAIRNQGGVIVKVTRPSLESTDTHDSETSVDLVEGDYYIVNDGSLDDLQRKVDV